MRFQNRSRNLSFFTIKHSFCNISWIISFEFIFVFINVKSLRWIRKFQRYNWGIFCWPSDLATCSFFSFLNSWRWFFLRALIHIILIILINHLIIIIFIKIILFLAFSIIQRILIIDILLIILFIILIFAFTFFIFLTFAFFSVFIQIP